MSAASDLALAIFDVDGTLVDSQDVIVDAMTAAFAEHGHVAPTRDAVKRIVGLELYEAVARLASGFDEEEVRRVGDAYKRAFIAVRQAGGGEGGAPLYPGAREALTRLSGVAPLLLGVATGKARRGLDHTLGAHGLAPMFTTTQTCSEAPGKPHPGMILNCLSETGVAAARTVMIGDTVFDMEMAANARVAAIGVAWGYHEVDELRAAGATIVLERFQDLDAAIVELIGPIEGASQAS